MRHRSASPYEEQIGFSRAIRVGTRILVSGSAPIGPDGKTVRGGVAEQAKRCFAILTEAIETLGGTAADVVRTRIYLVRAGDADVVGRMHAEAFRDARPAATMVVVAGLLDSAWLIEAEAEAEIGVRPEP